ncbi:TIR domain-containing protein [Salinibacterium sp. NG22]|uniref:TIR domain-containing protein n=1 Tax=Salinibacterium sp. NG22 TaxID=2792040 RepID=UPI0018CEE86E|nr:TIR domain-containing protein [Salinibacterium sp. NG22]MBH0108587.1 TIR domain-containing protein [Salinibacterium sp. NG22]
MAHKVYISFKTEDADYKNAIQALENIDYIDRSLNQPVNSNDDDYIMQVIRSDYLSSSTVTIFLIGQHSAESLGAYEQRFIKRELQASLYDGAGNSKSGILGIVLPGFESNVYSGKYSCSACGGTHNSVSIGDSTVVSEFSYNYYIPNNKCAHSESDRYCVLTSWDKFIADPGLWIERAYAKRSDPIAAKTRVRPS